MASPASRSLPPRRGMVLTGIALLLPAMLPAPLREAALQLAGIFPPPEALHSAVDLLGWCGGALLLIRLLNDQIWPRLSSGRQPPPKLLRDLTAGFVLVLAGLGIIGGVFHQSVMALLTTSTVMLGVIGFAVQSIIADGFSGLLISLNRPFKVGDWISIGPNGELARITEISWRITHLETTDGVTWIYPNQELTKHPLRVVSQPEPWFREQIRITLPNAVTPDQGRRLLTGAALAVPEVAALPRTPEAGIHSYVDGGISWILYYWCPHGGAVSQTRLKVMDAIVTALTCAHVDVPVTLHDWRMVPPVPVPGLSPLEALLRQMPLFTELSSSEIAALAQGSLTRIVPAGQAILRQGETGDSLFILREGLTEVRLSGPDGQEQALARLGPGQFVGETSLLTGAPRSASVLTITECLVTEITRSSLVPLMQARPGLAVHMGAVLEARRAARTAAEQSASQPDPDDARRRGAAAQALTQRILSFLLGRDGGIAEDNASVSGEKPSGTADDAAPAAAMAALRANVPPVQNRIPLA